MTESSLLDMSLLDESAEFGVEDLRELIDMYLAQADETMVGLKRAIGAGESDGVRSLAHKLAGSSAVCGVSGMVEPLRALESMGCEHQLANADQTLAVCMERLALCRQLLAEYLSDKGSPP
jgi:HPt (histidine-containing phosphotransfer) domain-containing protein